MTSRRMALAQAAVIMRLLLAWVLVAQESGLGAWIARSLGPSSIVAAVALPGVSALLLVAALLRWHHTFGRFIAKYLAPHLEEMLGGDTPQGRRAARPRPRRSHAGREDRSIARTVVR